MRIMADKKIVAHGSAKALQENPDPRVRQFWMVLLTVLFRSVILRAIIILIYYQ